MKIQVQIMEFHWSIDMLITNKHITDTLFWPDKIIQKYIVIVHIAKDQLGQNTFTQGLFDCLVYNANGSIRKATQLYYKHIITMHSVNS